MTVKVAGSELTDSGAKKERVLFPLIVTWYTKKNQTCEHVFTECNHSLGRHYNYLFT